MGAVVYILAGAAFTVAACAALGSLALERVRGKLHRGEHALLAFAVGAPLLSLAVFAVCAAGAAYKGVLAALLAGAVAAAWKCGSWRQPEARLPALSRWWRVLLAGAAGGYGAFYFINALAPEISPDGVSYHLAHVDRYVRARGLVAADSMYAHLSQGVEMIYLPAYAFGRHSAAAMTHLAFTVALAALMVCFGRRRGKPEAGCAAALFVFASPVIGVDGSSAYIDVAVACTAFALFYALEIWREEQGAGWLPAIGLLAGFCYAAKYSAAVAVPYALAVMAWTLRRDQRGAARAAGVVLAWALVPIAPWVVKNLVVTGNPLAPFFNDLFPNPHVHISMERAYRDWLRHYGVFPRWKLIFEATVQGNTGLLGPLFLLAPVGLAALWQAKGRRAEGRRIWLAALAFGLPYAANVGTRFLIPALPFVALAMAFAFAGRPRALAAVAALHAAASLPPVVRQYASPDAWRLREAPVRAALRLTPEDHYLVKAVSSYPIVRLLERKTPADARVYALSGPAEAYTTRRIQVGPQSAGAEVARDILLTPVLGEWQPTRSLRFRFEAADLRRIRVTQTAQGARVWSVTELRAFAGETEVMRDAAWRVRAHPSPWDVQMAFDGSSVTRWRSWEAARPGMFVEADFGGVRTVDAVRVEGSPDQGAARVRLEGMDESGRWRTLAESPEAVTIPLPQGLRREAALELRARGYTHLLLFEEDPFYEDFVQRREAWGLTEIGEARPWRLYAIDGPIR